MSLSDAAVDNTEAGKTFFNGGGSFDCSSGCAPGHYDGSCEEIDGCHACLGQCVPCPVGKFRATAGAVSESDCAECAKGTMNNVSGASSCMTW